jgi:Protein of unknown function (DUF3060)
MRVALRSVMATAGLAAASLVASPAHADMSVDCTLGPVLLSDSNESYQLVGACSTVTVTAANADVTMTSAQILVVDTSNTTVMAGPVGSLTASGGNNVVSVGDVDTIAVAGGNHDVTAAAVGAVDLTGGNLGLTSVSLGSLTVTAGANLDLRTRSLGRAVLNGSNSVLDVAGPAGPVRLVGSNNDVLVDDGTKLRVRGSNNLVRYDTLERLVIKGANNTATVRKGRTTVSVKGPNNSVRVHKRG